MIKEGRIGVQETIFLIVIALSNRIFFTAPAVVERSVGTAGWYMALISNIETIIFFTFIYLLLKRFPGKNIIEIFNVAFGNVIGFIFSIIYAAAFLVAGSVLMREFVDVLKIYVFPKTPISFLVGSLLFVIITSTFLGLESIARVAKLAGFTLLIGLLLLLGLASKDFNIANLFPFMGYGLGTTVFEGLTRSSAYSEIIIIAIFAGSVQGARHIKKAGYISLILSGLIVASSILCIEMVFPYYSFEELTAPLYELARSINYGVFLQRMDPLFLFLWIITTSVSGSIIFYCAISSYCKTFSIQDTRPVILPMAVILFAVTMIPKDLIVVVEKYIELLRIFPILLFYILPLVTLIVCVIRKKKGTVTKENAV